MSLRVLTAVTNAAWEADLVAALDGADLGVTVVRRCVDVADLLATASTGAARAAVLSADLRRLDRDVLQRLRSAKVAVVGLADPRDSAASRRLHQLGVTHVLPSDAAPSQVAAALAGAASAALGAPIGVADPRAALVPPTSDLPTLSPPPATGPSGNVVAIWGPIGSPGRSTVALGLADEASRFGVRSLLIDADSYGASIAQLLGLLDEAPGLAAATHLDNQGGLDAPGLAGLAREVSPALRVLTGITRTDRWPELRAESVRGVLEQARLLAPLTVVDCGFCLEDDEELSYDTVAPRRNGATLAVLDSADVVIAIGSGDPVGVQRLVRGIAELSQVAPQAAARTRVVINKLRRGPIGSDPQRQILGALRRFAGVTQIQALPYDVAATDKVLATGRTLADVAPESPLRVELRRLAGMLVASVPAV